MKYLKSALVDAHTADPGTTGLLTFAQRGNRSPGRHHRQHEGKQKTHRRVRTLCHWDKHPRETKGGKLYSGSEVPVPARVVPFFGPEGRQTSQQGVHVTQEAQGTERRKRAPHP